MNIELNKKQYRELIELIYWAVLEIDINYNDDFKSMCNAEDINYNDDFKSMCNAVRTADGSTLEENDPLFDEDYTEDD